MIRITFALTIIYLAAAMGVCAAEPMPIVTLSLPNPRTNEYLGHTIDIDGDRIIMGTRDGSFLVYDLSTRQRAYVSPTGLDRDVYVALEGMLGVVGSNPGAYIYDFTDLSDIKRFPLIPNDSPQSRFAGSVDIDGGVAIVGMHRGYGADNSGAAYLFDAATGAQIGELLADVPNQDESFGASVALEGGKALVGSHLSSDPYNSAVYLFDVRDEAAGSRLLDKFTVNVGPDGRLFGHNVGIWGDTLIAAEEYGNVFQWKPDGEPLPLISPGWRPFPNNPIRVHGDWIAVGNADLGVVDFYRNDGEFAVQLKPSYSPIGFGHSVALSEDYVAVAAPGGHPSRSVVYVYRLPEVVPEPATIAFLPAIGFAACVSRGRTARRRGASGVARRGQCRAL